MLTMKCKFSRHHRDAGSRKFGSALSRSRAAAERNELSVWCALHLSWVACNTHAVALHTHSKPFRRYFKTKLGHLVWDTSMTSFRSFEGVDVCGKFNEIIKLCTKLECVLGVILHAFGLESKIDCVGTQRFDIVL